MIRRLLTNQTKTITGAAIVLGVASFLSRIVGVLRDRVFAHQFGATNILDSYYAAFRIPDLIYNLLIVGALSAGFIPLFSKLWKENKEEAWRVTNDIIHLLGITLLGLSILLFWFAPALTHLIVPGFSPEKMQQTVLLTRIMLLSPFFLGLSSIVGSVLQSFKIFLLYALTPILYNVGIIFGAVVLVPMIGPTGLAYGVVFGALLHLAVQLPVLIYHGFRYECTARWHNPHVRSLLKLMIPRTLGIGANQVTVLLLTMFASTLGVGSLAIFNFANNLQFFPIGIIGVSFAVAAFPTLSHLAAEKNMNTFIDHLASTTRQILFFILPITILFLLLRAQIVRVAFGSGAFDWRATIETADALAFFSLSLFAQCLTPLLARAFYALHDTRTPFLIGIGSALVTITAAALLKFMGVAGLALGFSLGMIVQVALLWIFLRMRLGTLRELSLIPLLSRLSFAIVCMAVVVQTLKQPLSQAVDMTRFWGIFTQGLVSGGAGLLIYCFIAFILRVEEMHDLKASFDRHWLKLRQVPGEIKEGDTV